MVWGSFRGSRPAQDIDHTIYDPSEYGGNKGDDEQDCKRRANNNSFSYSSSNSSETNLKKIHNSYLLLKKLA